MTNFNVMMHHYSAPADPLAGFHRPTSKEREGREGEGTGGREGRKGGKKGRGMSGFFPEPHHITSHHKSYSAQSYRLKIDRLCITMSMLI